jgi:hypothetical protein
MGNMILQEAVLIFLSRHFHVREWTPPDSKASKNIKLTVYTGTENNSDIRIPTADIVLTETSVGIHPVGRAFHGNPDLFYEFADPDCFDSLRKSLDELNAGIRY